MKQIQEKLKDICSEKINIQDFSEIILTIREHHNTDVSLLTIGCDDEILNILNFFFNSRILVTERSSLSIEILPSFTPLRTAL